ncbi:MAG: MFS transporter, partial [Alphaproteobacteria bacterium]|nr:MFS transporter [Alphaproteobacteria bacterium]
MSDTDKSVFWSKRFYPLFFTQFLGAFNDNFFKNVVVFALVYQALELYSGEPEIIITAAAGIFILPFFLFSAVAGQLADKYPKDTIIKYIKLAEIGIAVLGVIGLYTSSLGLLIVVLFLFGAQSAFFSPSKFSILPQHLKPEELVKGNGYLSAGSNIAILAGTIIGGLMITVPGYGLHLTAVLMVLIAVTGYASSVLIPAAPAPSPKLKIDYNFVTETWNAMKYAAEQKRGVWLSILGIAWFYFLGAVFLAQFPVFAKENLLA